MIKPIYIFLILFSSVCLSQIPEGFIRGVDISFTPQIEDLGGQYKLNNAPLDPLEIYKQNGVNYVRLRLWHTPSDEYSGLNSTLEFAQRIKQAGLKLLLDFHYSDWWADPGKQTKPAAWNNLNYAGLLDSIYSYTYYVISKFKEQNAAPDIVQVGNEITPGFLWPEGRVGGQFDTQQQWTQFTNLLKNAINAVHDAADSVKIMIHIDRGGNNSASRWFFNHIRDYGVNYDIIGLSFYPWWHGTLTALRQNVNDLSLRYGKEIVVAETAYPWTLQWYDNHGNIVGSADDLHNGYPASVQGQYSFIYDVFQIVKEIPDNKGLGVFYWAPEYISVQPIGSPWENLALFDFQGNALNSIKVFNDIENDTSNAINVTFTLNTSTNYDTLKPDGYVQLRGEVVDLPDVLASGERLTWDINSEVILQNIAGDYWRTTVRVTPGTEIWYKYWTGHTKNKPTFLRLGSEGPIQSGFRKFTAGTKDTILPVEYYNSTGITREQYWSPFVNSNDSVGVMFRVNTADLLYRGIFHPEEGEVMLALIQSNSKVGDLTPVLSVQLSPEENSIAEESFWSGIVYFQKEYYKSNDTIKYQFGIQKSGLITHEDSNRSFLFPSRDTTLGWFFFNDRKTITDVESKITIRAEQFNLLPNYPNPFNHETKIVYELPVQSFVNLSIFDCTGMKIKTLYNGISEAGSHTVTWNGTNVDGEPVSSGIYFVWYTGGFKPLARKIMLMK